MKPSRQMVGVAGTLTGGGSALLIIGWISFATSASRYQGGGALLMFLGLGTLVAGVACGVSAWCRLAANVEEIGRLVAELPGAPRYLQLQDAPAYGAGTDGAAAPPADADSVEPKI